MNFFVVTIFLIAAKCFNVVIESAKMEFEVIDPYGFVRLSPLNQAKRNWLKETPRPNGGPERRIINGKAAKKGVAPYLVLVQYRSIYHEMKHWCGGAIYNRRTIVTAAHCIYMNGVEIIATDLKIVAGELNLNFPDYTEMRRVGIRVDIHPKYDPDGFINDIAVIKLHEPLRYTYTVQPIPIAKQGVKPTQGKLYIAGFGYTLKRQSGDLTHTHHFSSYLNFAEIDIISRTECKNKFDGFSDVLEVIKHPSVFCAIGAVNNDSAADACQGDSGGPAVCLDSNEKKYLCGIVNTGIGCGIPGYPGMYCDISYFHDWIREVAGAPGDPPTRDY